MSIKLGMYLIGVPLAFIWLFVQISGFTWILWGMIVLGSIAIAAAIGTVIHQTQVTPYQQFVKEHNEKAVIERARVEALQHVDEDDD